jgi:hypothetical protein
MLCLVLTLSFCEQLRSIISKYWWSQQDKDKMHWLHWDILKQPKDEGGMGFRDLYAFNIAMLAKQGWRINQNPNSFCAQILKAKYFPDGDILQVKAKHGASYTWRNILNGIELVKKVKVA